MKKILLLGLTAIIGTGAYAQYAQKSVVSTTKDLKTTKPVGKTPSKIVRPADKTRAASRWYDIVDAVDQDQGGTGSVYSNDNYNVIWTDSTMIYPYGSSTAPTYDGIWIKSLQQVIDPVDPYFNSAAYSGEAAISRNDNYTVDSIEILGVYNRNPAKTSIVDTLIVSVAKGNGGTTDLDLWLFSSADIISNYGDTVRFASVDQNVTTFIANGTTVWSKKIPLTATNANDTLSNGFNIWRLAPNMSVPAGNLVATTVTFKSGDTWTPFMDTARIAGSTTPNFNNFQFVSFEENAGAYQPYRKGYYNASSIMQQDTTGWGGTYVPSFAYTAGTYSYEHHWWSYKLNCPTCKAVGVNEISNINDVKVFPNPANNEVNFSMNVSESAKNVTIEISNAIGQVVKTVKLGSVNANSTVNQKVNVSDLSSGMYIYTINADGQKLSNKLMVH